MDITSSQINGQQRNESYNYDQVARLTQASGFYAQRNYTYDRWGNRTAMSGGSSQTISYATDGNNVPLTNRILSVNSGPSYTYDAAGDVTYDAGHSYGYDAESRMVTVDASSTATYFYDTANRRVKKVAGAYTTYYVWEGSNVIAEYGNAPVGSAGTRFYHADHLSNRMITDGSGLVMGTMDNLPFGEDGGVVGEREKHRFTNYERDSESSSDYAMNRQHSTSTGRFMRPDPLKANASSQQGFNRYAYVTNDPINLVDPMGLTLQIPGYCSAQYSSCGGGGDTGSGFSGTPFDDTPFGGEGMPASVAQGLSAYLGRLQNTYDALAANRAIQNGDWERALAILAGNPNLEIQQVAVLGIRIDKNDDWAVTERRLKELAKRLGGRLFIENDISYIIDVHVSYDDFLKKLESLGFSWFPDLLPPHFGGTDYATSEAPFFHITVGYPYGEVNTILPRGLLIKQGFRPDLTPPWITVHIDGTNPRSHWLDYIP